MVSTDALKQPSSGGKPPAARAGRWMQRSQWPTVFGIGLAIAAVVSGIATYVTLAGGTSINPSRGVAIALLLVNLAIVLTLSALIVYRLVRLWMARRAGSAGARLHVRLVAMFSFVAVMPAIIVAVFAAITLDRSFDAWFSERTRTIVTNASTVAEAYLNEHRHVLRADALAMATDLNLYAPLYFSDPRRFRDEVMTNQARLRALSGAFIADSDGYLMSYAEGSAQTSLAPPSADVLNALGDGEALLTANERGDQVQALVRLENFGDAFLLISRFVDPRVLEYLASTRAAAAEYANLESRRYTVQLTFALIYVIMALLVLLAAIWLGLWAANRIVAPISELVGAAERVSDGDLTTHVDVEGGADEVSALGDTFNRMTSQLRSQRNELIAANHQLDSRRRFMETVLSGVSAGVVGLDSDGRITLVNRSCLRLLNLKRDDLISQPLAACVPEMAPYIRQAMVRRGYPSEGQITLDTEDGSQRSLTIRIVAEKSADDVEGYVVTLDDVSDLVAAQRSSAWADIARRIAHEIKNPLTPIQLSAERLKRKYGAHVKNDPEIFEQCTNTIIRQVEDLGRMVDEFSSFARMPAASMAPEDLSELVREAVFLQRVVAPDITFDIEGADAPVIVECDRRLIGQALTNVLKNAVEAIATRHEKMPDLDTQERITVSIHADPETVYLEVTDTGIGLPRGERYRLVEPYVSRRDKGTGLGLAIVKKIMEDHAGRLTLENAPGVQSDARSGGHGARVRLYLPRQQAVDLGAADEAAAPDPAAADEAVLPFIHRASARTN